jgi:hypothetical protein
MTEYGLPSTRDKDGELQPVDHSYQWDGDEVTIKLIPPTISEFEEYESMGEETGSSELRDIIDKHLVKPAIPEDEDLTMRELLCYVEGIVDYSEGSSDEYAEEVQEELEQRQSGAAGN